MRAARHTAAIALTALVAGCGGHAARSPRPAGESPAPARESATLVVVGDSLTAGKFADTQADAFPQQVAAALHAQVEPLGVVGATTAQLAARPVPGGGKVVVVEAGTNDFLFQTARRRFADDYRALLAKVTAASPGAELICLTTWVPRAAAQQPEAKIPPSSYDATIRRECTAGAVANLASLPEAQPPTRGPAGRPTFLGPGDDFHPNSTGHAAIARLIESKLRSR